MMSGFNVRRAGMKSEVRFITAFDFDQEEDIQQC